MSWRPSPPDDHYTDEGRLTVQNPGHLAPAAGNGRAWSFADPVFVLCCGRSGSTLLRFLLDSHPELACPPETNVPALCAQLATVWSLIDGAPLSQNRGDEPPVIPGSAIEGIRHTMNLMIGSYLGRRGKKRYCDKSLGTARYAELLLRVYPEARFICLYRHPMDVISSGIEACPWGLGGYGFDPYIATTPGNSVQAMARFWSDNTAAIHAVERQFPDHCQRVRYEDLVGDPEAVASGLFEFLGLAPAPGVSEVCFSAERERYGPADHKIWYTSAITGQSVGRGWSIPAGLIAPPVRDTINELLANLGYLPVGEDWGTAEPPADLRAGAGGPAGGPGPAAAAPAPGRAPAGRPDNRLLRESLLAGLARIDARFARRWEPGMADTFVVIALPGDPAQPATRYRVDMSARAVTADDGLSGQPESDWDVIGAADAWTEVICRRTNLSVALRMCKLRYCDTGDAGPLTSDRRLAMLADLLGISSWQLSGAG
jgi:Sulfotransferase family